MSDIVERLNEGLYDQDIPTMLGPLLDEAAAEITRLRARIVDLEGQNKGLVITNGILRQRDDLPVDRLPVMREVQALRAENDRLREALVPFAKEAEQWAAHAARNDVWSGIVEGYKAIITMSDCRRAAAALKENSE